MIVEEIMTCDVVACGPADSLRRAAQIMGEADVSCTPVVERDGRRVVGMLTDRDICTAAVARWRSMDEVEVEAIMQRTVRWCWPDDSIESAEAIMRAYGVRRLAVIDPAGALVGLVSLSDIARQALEGPPVRASATEDVVETLAAMVGPPV
jgi:CBS domain-containing protein